MELKFQFKHPMIMKTISSWLNNSLCFAHIHFVIYLWCFAHFIYILVYFYWFLLIYCLIFKLLTGLSMQMLSNQQDILFKNCYFKINWNDLSNICCLFNMDALFMIFRPQFKRVKNDYCHFMELGIALYLNFDFPQSWKHDNHD